jgi:hypothetical protein
MVWITQGRTEHAAYILKELNGKKFVRWAATETTQWIDSDVEIKTELPRRRKGRRDKPTDFVFPSTTVISKSKTNNKAAKTREESEADVSTTKTSKKAAPKKSGATISKKKKKNTKKGGKKNAAKRQKTAAATTSTSSTAAAPAATQNRFKYPVGTQVYKVRNNKTNFVHICFFEK